MDIISFIIQYKYLAIFLAAIFEGPVTMAAVGFLYSLGLFNLLVAYFLLLLGDLAGDIGWYGLGYYGAGNLIKKYGKYLGLDEIVMDKVKNLFNKYGDKIVLISKLTMGLGFAVVILTTAGIARVSLKKFIFLNIIGGLAWTAFMMLVGYWFGNFYLLVSESLHIGFLLFIIIAIPLALYGISRYMRQQVLKNKI